MGGAGGRIKPPSEHEASSWMTSWTSSRVEDRLDFPRAFARDEAPVRRFADFALQWRLGALGAPLRGQGCQGRPRDRARPTSIYGFNLYKIYRPYDSVPILTGELPHFDRDLGAIVPVST